MMCAQKGSLIVLNLARSLRTIRAAVPCHCLNLASLHRFNHHKVYFAQARANPVLYHQARHPCPLSHHCSLQVYLRVIPAAVADLQRAVARVKYYPAFLHHLILPKHHQNLFPPWMYHLMHQAKVQNHPMFQVLCLAKVANQAPALALFLLQVQAFFLLQVWSQHEYHQPLF